MLFYLIKKQIKLFLKKIIENIINTPNEYKLGAKGKGVRVLGNTIIRGAHNVMLSDYVNIQPGCELYGAGGILIGEGTILAHDVIIFSQNHNHVNNIKYIPFDDGNINKKVIVGSYCWIGARTIILPGVTIGKSCIIGAGSVVNKDVPDYTIAAGNPVVFKKKRNNIQTIKKLEEENRGFIKFRRSI